MKLHIVIGRYALRIRWSGETGIFAYRKHISRNKKIRWESWDRIL